MSESDTPEVKCPGCGRRISWTDDWPERPFCSRRCRDLDFGAWASESYRIPGEPAWLDNEFDSETDNPDPGDQRIQ